MTAVANAATTSRAGTQWIVPLAVALAAAVVANWASAPYLVGVFHDDGVYALLARSLAEGQGFHYSHLPGAPAATHYPPLYPLALALAWRIAPSFPANVPTLLALNTLLVAVAACGWWIFATSVLGWRRGAAAAGALAATLALPVLALAGALLSEPFFLAALWPALLAGERAARSATRRDALVAGGAIGLLMLVRTHGIALLVAMILVLVLKREWRAGAWVAASAIVVQLPWYLWSHWASPLVPVPLQGSYGSYLGWWAAGLTSGGASFVLESLRVNVAECWLLLRDRFASFLTAPMPAVVAWVALFSMLAGAWRLVRHAPVTIAFLALYLGIVLVFPSTPWRYVWAVWPLVALVAMEGVRSGWRAGGVRRPAAAIAGGVLALALLRTDLHDYATRGWRAPARQAAAQIMPVLAWVRANTQPGDVVLSEGEQVVTLYTGRLSAPPISSTAREYLVKPTDAENATRLAAMLAAVPAHFVVLLAWPMIEPAHMLAAQHPGLAPLEPLSSGVVYKVVP